MNCHVVAFSTALDWLAVCWTPPHQLLALSFARRTSSAAVHVATPTVDRWQPERVVECQAPRRIRDLIERLRQYVDGRGDGDFRDVTLELSDRTEFQSSVLLQCQAIAPGQTISYGELARRAGFPRAARAVGGVMRVNRVPLVVPCHRVVASDGSLHGFSAPQGLRMKQQLLDLEASPNNGVG